MNLLIVMLFAIALVTALEARWPGRNEAPQRLINAVAWIAAFALSVLLMPTVSFEVSSLAHRFGDWSMVAEVERFNLDGLLALWHPASAN